MFINTNTQDFSFPFTIPYAGVFEMCFDFDILFFTFPFPSNKNNSEIYSQKKTF